jgi:hypothetical protein
MAPKMRVIVDGNTILNDELGDWQTRPPESLAYMIKPGYTPKPWMKALLVVMADAALTEESMRFEVNTSSRGRWSLSAESLNGT